MIGKNECVFMGKLAFRPKLSENTNGYTARAVINVDKRGSSNKIQIIAFGDTAKVLHNIGYKDAGIYAECRVETAPRDISGKKITMATFVADKFHIFESPKPQS